MNLCEQRCSVYFGKLFLLKYGVLVVEIVLLIHYLSRTLCYIVSLIALGRVICTCYAGYRFNQTLHRQSSQRSLNSFNFSVDQNSLSDDNENGNVGLKKACEDIDECSDGQSGCDQVISYI